MMKDLPLAQRKQISSTIGFFGVYPDAERKVKEVAEKRRENKEAKSWEELEEFKGIKQENSEGVKRGCKAELVAVFI